MSNLKGTIIATGANGTIGLAIAEDLLRDYPGYAVLLTVRNACDKNSLRLHSIVQKYTTNSLTRSTAEIEEVDLASLDSVKAFISKTSSKIEAQRLPEISAIICNAFTWSLDGRKVSADGYERSFQVNYLSHFALTIALLPHFHKDGRIVNLGSESHDGTKKHPMSPYRPTIPTQMDEIIHPLPDEPGTEFGKGYTRYGLSKLCLTMFTHALNKRFSQNSDFKNITALAIDPGGIPNSRCFEVTPLNGVSARLLMLILTAFAYITRYFTTSCRLPKDAAKDVIYFALSPKAAGCTGYYIGPTPSRSSEPSYDPELQDRVWRASVQWAGLVGYNVPPDFLQ